LTNSFIKQNGNIYIETHHVEPVSKLKRGVLSITNLMTVCANHHKQLHYGKVKLIENSEKHFVFIIDGEKIIIDKICIA
jgi:5-methylcytosine-specific restriction protein A